ncbi:hypothetical protein BV898_03468 [Hypsibius exemplaris]|uniref:Uncharacterized protein n=1 Tax=Hypsibius exemplaris TaxID=2072580 RepID=A0A1W0X588_HYPEX|nr:hypothetical protein BV898_03468 [Hypsibius exemplaris]
MTRLNTGWCCVLLLHCAVLGGMIRPVWSVPVLALPDNVPVSGDNNVWPTEMRRCYLTPSSSDALGPCAAAAVVPEEYLPSTLEMTTSQPYDEEESILVSRDKASVSLRNEDNAEIPSKPNEMAAAPTEGLLIPAVPETN